MFLESRGILPNELIKSLPNRLKGVPTLPKISTAASLIHHKLFGSVNMATMRLDGLDLASVPAEYLASLTACVTELVEIWNVSNIDLTSILDRCKSAVLNIDNQTLSTEETQALVRAMANVGVAGTLGRSDTRYKYPGHICWPGEM